MCRPWPQSLFQRVKRGEPARGAGAESKPPEGSVRIQIERSSDTVTILFEDDGRGMDPDAIRECAVEAGIVAPERAAGLAGEELLHLTYRYGATDLDQWANAQTSRL